MEASEGHWTCEACGCNTNQQADASCTICGTSNSGSAGSILRRGVGAAYAARAGWFARGLSVSAARRGMIGEEMGFDDEDIWDSVVDGVDMAANGSGDDPESAMESLAMDISSLAARSREARSGLESSRQRFLEAGRAFAQSTRDAQRINPEELMQVARENAEKYRPYWRDPTQASPRPRQGTGIEIGEGGRRSLAHLPNGASEGRAIRAEQAVPRPRASTAPAEMQASSAPLPASVDERPRRAFGFRVAFDHPNCEKGGNMGGCYLVGVTTASFSAYNESNGLHHSPWFWGVEDGANKYEGSRYSQGSRGRRVSTNNAVELGPQEVPMNSNNILFGSREVVTVVCDLDSRTLTFWRDETSLGTLVVNLPRSGSLFPVAVPFNSGVTVAITGLGGDPLPLLDNFAAERAVEEAKKEDITRKQLAIDRLVLVKEGKITDELIAVLRSIYESYNDTDTGETDLSYTAASRLWYRSGLKHSYLDSILPKTAGSLSFKEYLGVIEKVIDEDVKALDQRSTVTEEQQAFQVGDKVELVNDYSKFVDEPGGPLKPGDRGTVFELQSGDSGERRSVRVFHSGRRWWYPTKALVSERTGLLDSSGAWFMRRLLRVHGYSHKTLQPLASSEFFAQSGESGDRVMSSAAGNDSSFGRFISDGSKSDDPTPGEVSVQFVDKAFATGLGLDSNGPSESQSCLLTRLVAPSKIAYAPPSTLNCAFSVTGNEELDVASVRKPVEEEKSSISERLQAEIDGLSQLERTSIENLVKECRKNAETLSSLFANGLPEAFLSAMEVAERQMNSLEPREDLSERIAAVGGLATTVAELLFANSADSSNHECQDKVSDAIDSVASPPRRVEADTNLAASLQQRRTMLMSLVSRARRTNSSYFHQGIGGAELARDIALGHVPAPFSGSSGAMQPFVFGASSDHGDEANWEDGGAFDDRASSDVLENSNTDGCDDDPGTSDGASRIQHSFLDEILRCRAKNPARLTSQKYGASHSLFARQLIAYGILANDVEWAEATIGTFMKRSQVSQQSSATVLRHLVDEQGLSIMRLAILFGCSPKVLYCLVACGAQVDAEDVRLAAVTGQHIALSFLLRYKPMKEGDIDVARCSSEVIKVLNDARKRHAEMDAKMRADGGSFVSKLLRKMIDACLVARHLQSPRLDNCSRSIADVLVGNSLLLALQDAQKVQDGRVSAITSTSMQRNDASDQTGRFSVEETLSEMNTAPKGLLGSLPIEVLAKCFIDDAESLGALLRLAEDFLCSKDHSDVAAGLSLVTRMLVRFPSLQSSTELLRYGFSHLITFHDDFASMRLSKLLLSSRQPRPEASSPLEADSGEASHHNDVVIRCPSKHVAVLHVTRHSSFRCDLCGCGVERGRPMHGCRECDWDACESCMDQAESGLVKCECIRKLVNECRRLLLPTDVPVGSETKDEIALTALTQRVLQKDATSIAELATFLNTPGRVTFHQFLGRVMPALYSACVPTTSLPSVGSNHRSKKARVLGVVDQQSTFSVDSEARRLLCDTVVRSLIGEVMESKRKPGNIVKKEETDGGVDYEFKGMSELVRRLQQVISLYEDVPIFHTSFEKADAHNAANELQSLKKALAMTISPSKFEELSSKTNPDLRLSVEPLLVMKDLERQILRTSNLSTPDYVSYCSSLTGDRNLLIVERSQNSEFWRLARILSYDKESGAHTVVYASEWSHTGVEKIFHVNMDNLSTLQQLKYTGQEVKLLLAAREYFILNGAAIKRVDSDMPDTGDSQVQCDQEKTSTPNNTALRSAIGQRVESNVLVPEKWTVYTLRGFDEEASKREGAECFTIVADDGSVHTGVLALNIRAEKSAVANEERPGARGGGRRSEGREVLNRAFPFLSARQGQEMGRSPTCDARSMKRTWSALSLATALQPVDLNLDTVPTARDERDFNSCIQWPCKIGDDEIMIVAAPDIVENPVKISIKFSPHPKMPCSKVPSPDETTLIATMRNMHESHPSLVPWPLQQSCTLFYSISLEASSPKQVYRPKLVYDHEPRQSPVSWSTPTHSKRSRNLVTQSPDEAAHRSNRKLCNGLDEPCVKSMELLNVLSHHIGGNTSLLEKDHPVLAIIANASLSRKLAAQLNDPVSVVGGALPQWCTLAPTFAPSTFSYDCRRKVLERVAFGVSRGVFKQQEAKVNVGRYRQRMAALRARAVELVGEAFSGGAEDPTALQLQADELYGMEEALATRVRAAFRAVKWQEHSLQVAKAAVRRDRLLADAAVVMQRYSTDDSISRRRLEVRFEGESGFDAAQGDEAGVTRGFYADVSEALLSGDTIAGVYCANTCAVPPEMAALKSPIVPMQIDESPSDCPKIPLWIPDMDTSGKVVIPTPRADKRSALGVFPRPIPHYHPQMADVQARFRFIGRLFAAAVRDGFMFPLPLSAAFLKLVQECASASPIVSDRAAKVPALSNILSSSELPRPGFLGGEIYAAEAHICRKLDALDRADPPLSRHELEKQYGEIATDPLFAREALGKSYDCSFEEYFQDKTFVDPLDPTQGEDAVPLCPNGSQKAVTIRNVREWVALAKNFVLHDGVIAQAIAFRQGVADFFRPVYLGLFTCEEWQRDICGVGDNVDHWDDAAVRKLLKLDGGKGAAEALVAVAAIGGEGGAALSRRFGPSSPTIQFLIQALLKATPQQRRQFLSFVTSVPIATPGRIEVVPIVSPSGDFMPMNDPTCLPRANTCARRLYLPKFDTQQSFDDVLWAVVREECRFKGFYEWRGS